MRKRNIFAIAAIAMSIITATTPAYAETITINEGDTTKSATTTAGLTIDNTVIEDMGYGLIASVPVTMDLAYDSNTKSFKGASDVYASGIVDAGKSVNIKTTQESINSVTQGVHTIDVTGYGTCEVTKDHTFDAETCMANSRYFKESTGSLVANSLKAEIKAEPLVKGVAPDTLGEWTAAIPITIEIVNTSSGDESGP